MSDEGTRKRPAGKTYLYHAAAALGRRRMAQLGKKELRAHQQKAARARWDRVKKQDP